MIAIQRRRVGGRSVLRHPAALTRDLKTISGRTAASVAMGRTARNSLGRRLFAAILHARPIAAWPIKRSQLPRPRRCGRPL